MLSSEFCRPSRLKGKIEGKKKAKREISTETLREN